MSYETKKLKGKSRANKKVKVSGKITDIQTSMYDELERRGYNAEDILVATDFWDRFENQLKN